MGVEVVFHGVRLLSPGSVFDWSPYPSGGVIHRKYEEDLGNRTVASHGACHRELRYASG